MFFRPLSTTIISFLLYSVSGWVFEVIYCSIKEGHPINRGFLNGPYCPIYGVGACFVGGMLAGIGNPIALFILGAVLCCCVEYATSWVLERAFHARWWDYSHRRFNLHGRVCLAGAMLFGTAIVSVVYVIQPALNAFLAVWPTPVIDVVGAVIALCFAVDVLITAAGLTGFHAMSTSVSDAIVDSLKGRFAGATLPASVQEQLDRLAENTTSAQKIFSLIQHDIASRFSRINLTAHINLPIDIKSIDIRSVVKQTLTSQQLRVLQAFPHLEKQWTQHVAQDAWARLREYFKRH